MKCKKCFEGMQQGYIVKYEGRRSIFLNHYVCEGGILKNGSACTFEYTKPTAFGAASGLVTKVGENWIVAEQDE